MRLEFYDMQKALRGLSGGHACPPVFGRHDINKTFFLDSRFSVHMFIVPIENDGFSKELLPRRIYEI